MRLYFWIHWVYQSPSMQIWVLVSVLPITSDITLGLSLTSVGLFLHL